MLQSQLQKMGGVAVHILKLRRPAVGAQEGGVVVQPHQSAPPGDLPGLTVGEVPQVGAQGPGVGVGGRNRGVRLLHQVPKPPVVQVGDVQYNSLPDQLSRRLPAEGAQPVVGLTAGADGVLPVPGEGDHHHPRPGQLLHPPEVPAQHSPVLHGEEQGGPALSPGLHRLPGGAAEPDTI